MQKLNNFIIMYSMLMLDSVKFIVGNVNMGREKYKEKEKGEEEDEKTRRKMMGIWGSMWAEEEDVERLTVSVVPHVLSVW